MTRRARERERDLRHDADAAPFTSIDRIVLILFS